ncbi:hypothetical protein [Pseudomonas syringae]|uniref:hypothetical protein n=1 Tax=Pseudomonas syringae TaxID=317 RepID=UPI000CDB1136|nr:hypothetical protein [Pseudomonas syringae]POP71634.1 hypothetical protein CXB35_02690 [Pseudomonas syringae]
MLGQKSAIRPGSIFNRQGGSVFNQRQHFDDAELTPSAIGYRAWFSKYVDIIYDSDQFSLVDSLINGFWDEGMRTVNRAVTIIDRQPMAVFANPRIMIVGSEAMPEYL